MSTMVKETLAGLLVGRVWPLVGALELPHGEPSQPAPRRINVATLVENQVVGGYATGIGNLAVCGSSGLESA
jgi:hypothetical protein